MWQATERKRGVTIAGTSPVATLANVLFNEWAFHDVCSSHLLVSRYG